MASKLNPYVNVTGGRSRQALEFWQSVLGGGLHVSTFGENGMEGPLADQIMHGQLETPAGFTLMAADAPPEMFAVTEGNNVTVSISGDAESADDMRGWFAGLAEGGQITQPLEVAPWGDEFGMLVDKFGINWMVNIAGNAQG